MAWLRSWWPVFAIVVLALLGRAIDLAPHQAASQQEQPAVAPSQNSVAGQPVAIAVTDKDRPERKQKKNWYDYFLDHLPDWFVAIFTGLLVFVTYRLVTTTGGLRASTDKLWEAGEKQLAHFERTAERQAADMQASVAAARRSADAAKESADAATHSTSILRATERAYLFGGPTNIGMNDEGTRVWCKLTVDNPGRTPAFLKVICVAMEQALPDSDAPDYEDADVVPVELVINSSVGLNPLAEENKIILPFDVRRDCSAPRYMYVWGYFEYIDIFKDGHTARFCTRIHPKSGKFELVGGPAWNDWD